MSRTSFGGAKGRSKGLAGCSRRKVTVAWSRVVMAEVAKRGLTKSKPIRTC